MCAQRAATAFGCIFFFGGSRRYLLSSLASQSRACACSAMGMRDGNMIYSPFLHYFLNPAPTTYVESGLHTPWILLPDSWTPITSPFEPLPSSSLPGSWHPPGSARAARRLIATDGEGGRRTSKGGVTALMRAMRLTPRE